jgi:hypothetical protein
MDQANRQQKLGFVWRNRKKISQINKDNFCLPFFLLIILWLFHRAAGIQLHDHHGVIIARYGNSTEENEWLPSALSLSLSSLPVGTRSPGIGIVQCPLV